MADNDDLGGMTLIALEKRIAAALSANVASDDLEALLAELNDAIEQTAIAAKAERAKSLDLATTPAEAATAAQRVTLMDLQRERFQLALPKITERLREICQREYAERWQVDRDKVAAQRNASAEQFERLPDLFAQIIAIFNDAEAVNREISRVNGNAPDGVPRLAQVENFARDLPAFTRTMPSLAEVTTLFDFKTGAQLWPPKKPPLASYFAPAPAHPGSRWHEHVPQWQEQQRRDTARVANYYNAQHDARQQAENREAAERAAALRRGGE
jgi:hypothetical protein